jgi:hypothetical protein
MTHVGRYRALAGLRRGAEPLCPCDGVSVGGISGRFPIKRSATVTTFTYGNRCSRDGPRVRRRHSRRSRRRRRGPLDSSPPAGSAVLGRHLARAMRACCAFASRTTSSGSTVPTSPPADTEASVVPERHVNTADSAVTPL